MSHNVLSINGFKPLLIVAFLNAFVDLGHKITVQNIVFATTDDSEQIMLTAVLNALMLLPFVLISTIAGSFSDRFHKGALMASLAFAAVALTAVLTVLYISGLFWAAYWVTLLLALQAAFYSPAKFGMVRETVGVGRLSEANGWMQAVSIAAILLGTLAFSLPFDLLRSHAGETADELVAACWPLGVALVLFSLVEWRVATRLPRNLSAGAAAKWIGIKEQLSLLRHPSTTFTASVALAIFFGVSQTVLAVYPAYVKGSLGITSVAEVQALIGISVVGIALGSLVAGSLGKGFVETGAAGLGAVGYAASFLLSLVFDSYGYLVVAFLAMGFFAGFVIVPLSALIQQNARQESLGSTLAAMNLLQSVGMLLFLAFAFFSGSIGIDARSILLCTLLIWSAAAVWLWVSLPEPMARAFVGILLFFRYRLSVRGEVPREGVLLVGNHQSWLDWAVLQAVYPVKIHFLMEREIVRWRVFRWWLPHAGVVEVSSSGSKDALKKAEQLLKSGKTVAIFAEGQITRDGEVGEFKRGFEICARRSDAKILPFRIDGVWGSTFSYSPNRFSDADKKTVRRQVEVSFGKLMESSSDANSVRAAVLSA